MRCGIVFLAIVALAASEDHNKDYDNLDVQAIVSNTEELKGYLDCFLDKKPCNEIQQSFKVSLPEAIQQACAKCSAARKNMARIFMAAAQEKLPNEYNDFKNKYDPENKYFPKLQETLAKA